MQYTQKPKMILFDVGETLFNDGKCNVQAGFEALLNYAVNPHVTCAETLNKKWNEYLQSVGKAVSQSGVKLETPLSSVLKFVSMQTGLEFDITVAEQEEIFDRFNSSRRVFDGIPQLLAFLNASDIRTAVISNNMMSGESLALSLNRFIPENKFEFCVTSADLLFCKPSKEIFVSAACKAGINPTDCWYCGDGRIPDVDGAKNAGMAPVLFDINSENPVEFRTDGNRGRYLAVNSWVSLMNYTKEL